MGGSSSRDTTSCARIEATVRAGAGSAASLWVRPPRSSRPRRSCPGSHRPRRSPWRRGPGHAVRRGRTDLRRGGSSHVAPRAARPTRWRRRSPTAAVPAICCRVLTAIEGCSCISPRNTHSVSPSSLTSVAAVTVAVRGPPSRSAISPKKSPGFSVVFFLPPIVTSASPSTITNKPDPWLALSARSRCPRGGRCPSRLVRSSAGPSSSTPRRAVPGPIDRRCPWPRRSPLRIRDASTHPIREGDAGDMGRGATLAHTRG